MYSLYYFLRWLYYQFWWWLSWILPFIAETRAAARAARGLWAFLLVCMHLLLLACVLWALWWVNSTQYFRLYDHIAGPVELRKFWLPIIFLLIYAEGWLSYWLYILLTMEDEDVSRFPDIDKAWDEAVSALRQTGVALSDLPLILILGRPEDDEKSLFQAAELKLQVNGAPAREAPLHLYATQQAIYLTCAGASLLGYYATSLGPKNSAASTMGESFPANEPDISKTLPPDAGMAPEGGERRPTQGMADLFLKAEREGRKISKVEQRMLRALYRKDNVQRGAMRNVTRVDEQSARLRRLCRLIVRDRHPYCAANGILILIPFAGTDTPVDAADTAAACQRDLETIAALKVDCPIYTLVCDMETAPGFVEFVQRFRPEERRQRAGSGSPLVPDFRDAGARVRLVQDLANYICRSSLQRFVYGKFQTEKTGEELESVIDINSRLFLLFDEMHERCGRLARILEGLVAAKVPPSLLLFGGCYFAGTGTEASTEQAFVQGVLAEKILNTEETVYWSAQAQAQDAAYYRWCNIGWIVLAVVVVAALAIAAVNYANFSFE